MPGFPVLVKAGVFDADSINALNTAMAATPDIVAANSNPTVGFAVLAAATAVTLLPAGHAAGTYRVNIYGVVTTTITTATSWLFPIGYTDDQGARAPTATTSSTMTAGTVQQVSFTLRSTGATALTITPTATSAAAGAIAYSVVVERII